MTDNKRSSSSLRNTTFALIAALGLTLAVPEADAKRLGGGKSFGRQSPTAMQQHQQQPPMRDAVGQPGQPAAQAPAPVGAQPARPAPAGNRWLGPLAGLAAGLGIAALLSHLGLSGAFASFLGSMLMIALLVFAGLFIWRMLRGGATQRQRSPMEPAYGGAGPASARDDEVVPAAAREVPSHVMREAAAGARPGSVAATLGSAPVGEAPASVPGQRPPGVPADFDVEGFLRNAKVHFHRLQSAWDRKDLQDIQSFTTPEVFAEIRMQLAEESGNNYTEVVSLQADLLAIEESGSDWLASVRYAGTMRDAQGAPATEFQEIWNLAKRKDGSSGWLLAGMQQIQ